MGWRTINRWIYFNINIRTRETHFTWSIELKLFIGDINIKSLKLTLRGKILKQILLKRKRKRILLTREKRQSFIYNIFGTFSQRFSCPTTTQTIFKIGLRQKVKMAWIDKKKIKKTSVVLGNASPSLDMLTMYSSPTLLYSCLRYSTESKKYNSPIYQRISHIIFLKPLTPSFTCDGLIVLDLTGD